MRKQFLLAIYLFLSFVTVFMMIAIGRKIFHMDFPIAEFSQGILSAAAYRNVDIGAVKKTYFLYALVLSPGMFLGMRFLLSGNGALGIKRWCLKVPFFCRMDKMKISCPFGVILFLMVLVNGVSLFRRYQSTQQEIFLILALIMLFLFLLFALTCFLSIKKGHSGNPFHFYVFWLAFSSVLGVLFCLLEVAAHSSIPFPLLWGGTVSLLYVFLWKIHDFSADAMGREEFIFKPVFVAGVAVPFILEILYTLDVHKIFISPMVLLLPYGISFFFCWQRWRRYDAEAVALPINSDAKIYFWAFCSTVWIPFYHAFLGGGPIDFFEGANHGISLYDFFHGFGWPILANFDAHMLFAFWGGVFYGFRTQDFDTAIFAPDFYMIQCVSLCFMFYLFKLFMGYRKAYVFLLFNAFLIEYSSLPGIGLLVYFVYWMNHPSRLTHIIFAILFSTSFLFRLDMGVSFGGAFLLCGLSWIWLRNRRECRKFVIINLLTGFVVAGAVLAAFVYQHIDIREWLSRFLLTAVSDANWAYGFLGNSKEVAILYLLIPIVLFGIFFYCIRCIRQKTDDSMVWSMGFLYTAWALNIPRALVRHNMVENSIVAYGIPFLLLGLFAIYRYRHFGMVFFMLLSLTLLKFTTPINVYNGTILQLPMLQQNVAAHRTVRPLTETDTRLITDMKTFLDNNLAADETYLDFTNQTLLYALVGRKNPVWINQSPALINGNAGQREFLQELLSENIPFVLMPYAINDKQFSLFSTLDGIPNVDRYYLLTEYIGQNYRPLCVVDRFAVWCRKQDYESFRQKNMDRQLLDTYAYDDSGYYYHDLGAIPFLWGSRSTMTDTHWLEVRDGLIEQKGGRTYGLDWNVIRAGEPAFLSLIIEAETDGKARVVLAGLEGEKSVVYDFKVMQGSHHYRLRCSSDILWYGNVLDKIDVKLDNRQKLQNIFLEREDG